MNEIVLGIDLGTTFSAMAWVDDEGRVEIIPNREGDLLTASVVLVEGDRLVVGREAVGQAIARPNDVVQCIKRQMGNAEFKFKGHTPVAISAAILRKLVQDAEAHFQKPVHRAVITVPAYFTGPQRQMTQEAGRLAGLQVEEPLDEPEAAAIHFGVSQLEEGERVLVCDLGGGTYDATVLAMAGGVLKADRTRGAVELGGHDWTTVLNESLARRIREGIGCDPHESLALWQHLHDQAEQAKCRLSDQPAVSVAWSQHGRSIQLQVTRDEFEAECAYLMQQVLDLTMKAVRDPGLTMADITHVLLVGGSSRLPSFVAGIARLTGRTPKTRNPDEAVARGAALVAHAYATGSAKRGAGRIMVASGRGATRKIVTIQRRSAHALGTIVATRTPAGLELVNESIIPENSDLPISREREDYCVEPGGTTFQTPVIELDCHGQQRSMLGSFRFSGAPKRAQRAPIRVRFSYDGAKVPDVEAWDVQTGTQLQRQVVKYEPPDLSRIGTGESTTVVLAVDCSGSMYGAKIAQAKTEVMETATRYLGAANRSVAVVGFGGSNSIYPSAILASPTQSLGDIRSAIGRMDAGGGTPMEAGLVNIRQILESAPGQRIAIVFTDGQPNDVAVTRQTAQTFEALNIVIGTVPIGSDADRSFLASIGDLESSIRVDDTGKGMAAAALDILFKASKETP